MPEHSTHYCSLLSIVFPKESLKLLSIGVSDLHNLKYKCMLYNFKQQIETDANLHANDIR